MTMLKSIASLDNLDHIFSPFVPVTRKEKFYGREQERTSIQRALREHGRHILMYGERGVGKTSLANIILNSSKHGLMVRITLNQQSSLASIWRDVLEQLQFELVGARQADKKSLSKDIEALLRSKSFSTNSLLRFFKKLNKPVLIVLDEFDVLGKDVSSSFAYVLKSFSDNLQFVTFFLIGIADTITDLISNHASIERCMLQVRLPRMKQDELSDMIDSGLNQAGLFIDPKVKEEIIHFSKGLPYYVQLITKYAAQSALGMRYNTIVHNNLKEGIQNALQQMSESASFTYEVASASKSQDNPYQNVVKACAMVVEDERGLFRLSDVRSIMRKQNAMNNDDKRASNRFNYQVRQLCRKSRGRLLRRIEFGNNTLYCFNNPIVKAYILLKLHQEGDVVRTVRY